VAAAFGNDVQRIGQVLRDFLAVLGRRDRVEFARQNQHRGGGFHRFVKFGRDGFGRPPRAHTAVEFGKRVAEQRALGSGVVGPVRPVLGAADGEIQPDRELVAHLRAGHQRLGSEALGTSGRRGLVDQVRDHHLRDRRVGQKAQARGQGRL